MRSKTDALPVGVALWCTTIHFHGRGVASGIQLLGTPPVDLAICVGGFTGAGVGATAMRGCCGATSTGPLNVGAGRFSTTDCCELQPLVSASSSIKMSNESATTNV